MTQPATNQIAPEITEASKSRTGTDLSFKAGKKAHSRAQGPRAESTHRPRFPREEIPDVEKGLNDEHKGRDCQTRQFTYVPAKMPSAGKCRARPADPLKY